jgi:LuxR family maltose regulon positive regulatory protein
MVEILGTKLFIPRPRTNLVSRPHLIDRLIAGQDKKLTLIAAPVGFGKTTLLSEWIPKSPRCVTWLSLDEGDNSPTRFWMYFIAALQTISPELGRGVQALLLSMQPHDFESILTVLINEIKAFGETFVHVFDDYHLIESTEIDHELAYLIDHQPSNLRLIIATREEPHLPLARLRASDQLVELRSADLRFTPSETTEFLNQMMELNLSVEEVSTLKTRTEGWIAGLQLAAIALRSQLSMEGNKDVSGFIREFAGDHRYIVDYLIEEVLQRQSECVRNFLLQTSILERLNGPLCDAVTGQVECNVLLETLERGNYFVIPLDDKRHWYRYHQLFGDVLRMRLMTEQPDQIPILHRRASEWYEQNGSAPESIRHALAGKDFERAADLIELAWPKMRMSRQESTMFGWVKALPDNLFRARPVLSVACAWALLVCGQLEGVEARLRDAEQWLDTADRVDPMADISERTEAPSAKMVVVDEEEFRCLPGSIAVYRAAQALALSDLPGTEKYARRALDLVSNEDHVRRGAAAVLLGLASWASGDLETAHRTYTDGMASVLQAGYFSHAIGSAIALADIRIAQGRLHEAMRTYEQALRLAAERGMPALRETADIYVGMSVLEREHNDLNAAVQYLVKSQELGELAGLPQNRYRWRVAMARIREAQGNLDGALDLLHEAEGLYVSDFFPKVRPIPALKTRVWVALGRFDEALDWVHAQGLSAEDDLSYLREFEHITLARVLLARYKNDHKNILIGEAIGFLERLLRSAEEGGRIGSVIEILILQALAYQLQGDNPSTLIPLERALTLAEPQNYIRTFVDEGLSMRQLLLEAAERGIMPDYTGKLLSAFEAQRQGNTSASPIPASQTLVEPLSQRELEVLRLLKTDLLGPEIARELVIALSTVRAHTKSIFNKLSVNDRRAAVKRAAELGLI